MLSSVCFLISFCGVVDSCSEIIVYVVYVVSCVGNHFLPLLDIVVIPVVWFC
jgi:hypothetical protein